MNERYNLIQGDCLEKLKELEDNSVDAIITDPPYELGFMGKKWDSKGIAFNQKVWEEALRVLKPAGHLLSFGGTRTNHRMVCAIEDAGFEIRDCISWNFGSGFPKSQNISQMYEKGVCRNEFINEFGRKPEIIKDEDGKIIKDEFKEYWESWKIKGERNPNSRENCTKENTLYEWGIVGKTAYEFIPKTEFGKEWEGWGTALKPAHELICLARKPLSEKTIAENVLKWGTGGLNIDACRIGTNELTGRNNKIGSNIYGGGKGFPPVKVDGNSIGRFPANFIHDGSKEVLEEFEKAGNCGAFAPVKSGQKGFGGEIYGKYKTGGDDGKTFYQDGLGTPARFFQSCEFSEEDYAPFYYSPKASKSERNAGCDKLEEKHSPTTNDNIGGKPHNKDNLRLKRNNHPTVKPIRLLEYLIKLTTKQNQVVLDMFMGSGSTGVACMNLGRRFVGIELEEEYMKIAEARISHHYKILTNNDYRMIYEQKEQKIKEKEIAKQQVKERQEKGQKRLFE